MSSWEPANDTERALATALAAGDRQGFFGIIGVAELFLPQILDTTGDAPAGGQRFVTADLFGHTFLPVFTSIEGMLAHVDGVADSYTVTNYGELRRKWPAPEWRLAVNPGAPIDAYVTIDAVEGIATGEVSIPTAAEVILDAVAEEQALGLPVVTEPSVDTEATLRAAVERGDSELYLRTLLDAVVILPTARGLDDAGALLEPDFPWRPAGDPTAPAIEVFTSAAAFAHTYPVGVPNVKVAMPFLLSLWPPGYALSVDPGTALAVELSEEQVPTLLLWSIDDEAESLRELS